MTAVIIAWLLAKLPGFAISLALEVLKKTGVISQGQVILAETGEKVLHVIGNVKTYSSPEDFPEKPPNA